MECKDQQVTLCGLWTHSAQSVKLDRAKPTTKTAVADALTDHLQAAAKSRIELMQWQRPSLSVCLLVRLSDSAQDLEVESSRIGKIAIKISRAKSLKKLNLFYFANGLFEKIFSSFFLQKKNHEKEKSQTALWKVFFSRSLMFVMYAVASLRRRMHPLHSLFIPIG